MGKAEDWKVGRVKELTCAMNYTRIGRTSTYSINMPIFRIEKMEAKQLDKDWMDLSI